MIMQQAFKQNPIMIVAVIAISAAYIISVAGFVALVLVMHDGEATNQVSANLTQLMVASLGTLSLIVGGHQVTSYLTSQQSASAPSSTATTTTGA